MGADGGVNWVEVNPKNYTRVYDLTCIFRFWQQRESRMYEDYHSDWLNANPEIKAPQYLVGYYGTSHGDYDQGAYSLVEIIGYGPTKHRYADVSECDNVDLTFEELWMDLLTREPWKQGEWARTPLENQMWDRFFETDYDAVCKELGLLRHMYVGDWFRELCSKVGQYGSCETWT